MKALLTIIIVLNIGLIANGSKALPLRRHYVAAPSSKPIAMIGMSSFSFSQPRFACRNSDGTPCWTCDGSGFSIKAKNVMPQTINSSEDMMDSCKSQWKWMQDISPATQDQYKIQYDSLRHYIETCALVDSDWSYQAFTTLDVDVQDYNPTDTTRYDRYRDWLLSVLYLNPNPHYFCACVESISGTYAAGIYHNVPNAGLAVIKYLIDNKSCNSQGLDSTYSWSIQSRHQQWLNGNRKIPEDTILPSLDSIGLGILLHHQGVTPSTYLPNPYLVSVSSSPNPFKNETTISFTLNRMAYITVDVFDVLGHKVWGSDHGGTMDAGVHTIRLDGAGLPTGTLYARISTGFGEVKTAKLVKQE
ncbi:MAG TPA: T9SS type A sorting domain-containing protein [Candidatus Kapabacteria bacterium]|nr:T9SS type A sorting domain-containing protein [Candidatus Kapabacteria bacterium]